MEDLLTTAQLAVRLQVSAETVRHWARSGRIPVIRASAKVRRYVLADVVEALGKRSPKLESVGCH